MAASETNVDLQFSEEDSRNKSTESVSIDFNEMTFENKAVCNAVISEDTEDVEVTYIHDNFSQV